MASLDRIQLEGFKSIRELDLELRSLNVLIGANGAGKSNFISIFELLHQLVDQNLQNHVTKSGGADNLLYFGQKTTDEIHIKLSFEENGYTAKLAPTIADNLFFAKETCWYDDREFWSRKEAIFSSGQLESKLEDGEQSPSLKAISEQVAPNMKSWQIYQFHDTSDTARIKATGKINDNAYLRPDASNLAAFLYRLQETQFAYYDRIIKTIRKIAPFFDNFRLRPNPLNEESIRLEWQEKGSDQYFNAHSLSDGTLRFISLATLLLQPDDLLPSTILIDEPELGLHPYAIVLLASLLRSTATKTQIIVATQSVPLVNQFAPEDIIIVDRKDRQSTFSRLNQAEIDMWLEEYRLGDLWEKNIIGGRPQP